MKKKISFFLVLVIALSAVLTACGAKEDIELYYSPGDAFITNVRDTEALVKLVVSLGMSRDETELLTLKNPVVRDCILRLLRTATMDELKAPDAQVILSDKIIGELNAIPLFPAGETGKPLFTRVYYLDFVIQ